MRVPEDVTLLLCDDNWGNIRKLPKLSDKPRSGGYGIYYHYDYVGGPRNYKWLNTNPIARIWEQMHLAYRYGAKQIWVVNVGDIKPMEYPIAFFLDYAWNPEEWPADRLPEYSRLWAERTFGKKFASQIADILTTYTKFNSRRKPELLSPNTFSLTNYREAETIVSQYNQLAEKTKEIYKSIPSEYKDAFYQLVLHPVEACSNLNDLYVTVGKNRLYARQGRAATNDLAERARLLFKKDAEITNYYNTVMANGKWNHMMDQTHIGYTYWQQPEKNTMPNVKEITLKDTADLGVAIEGSDAWWPNEKGEAQLPEFDPYHRQSYYIDIFNRGNNSFNYSVGVDKPWIIVSKTNGKVHQEERVEITINWQEAPTGRHVGLITVTGPDTSQVSIQTIINIPIKPKPDETVAFVESNNYISIEAENFSRAVAKSPVNWQIIPNLGRTKSGVMPVPVTAATQTPENDSPRLEYTLHLFNKGEVVVKTYLSPTLNFHNNQGLRYAVSFDNERPQIINIHAGNTFQDWEESVRNNITTKISRHNLKSPGDHVLKFWMVDPGIVLQKLVIETGDVKPSYLGPPESFHGRGKDI
jgi:hypothetical protein